MQNDFSILNMVVTKLVELLCHPKKSNLLLSLNKKCVGLHRVHLSCLSHSKHHESM